MLPIMSTLYHSIDVNHFSAEAGAPIGTLALALKQLDWRCRQHWPHCALESAKAGWCKGGTTAGQKGSGWRSAVVGGMWAGHGQSGRRAGLGGKRALDSAIRPRPRPRGSDSGRAISLALHLLFRCTGSRASNL